VPVSLVSGSIARADLPGGHTFWVMPLSATAVGATIHTGEVSPIRGWVSPDYGCRVPAPMVVYSASGPLPMRQVTILWPERGEGVTPPVVAPILDDDRRPTGVRVTPARLTIHFNQHVVIERD
jgi:hypothetical protein